MGFDWPDAEGPAAKAEEELAEVRAVAGSDGPGGGRVTAEVGDLLFAVVNLARHLGVDPEAALRGATATFLGRFYEVERLAQARGIDLAAAGLDALDELWEEVKAGPTAPL